MKKFKYQNMSTSKLELMGFGVVEAGKEIITDRAIENPNFKYLGEAEDSEQNTNNEPIVAVQEPQANVVTEAEPVTNMEIN